MDHGSFTLLSLLQFCGKVLLFLAAIYPLSEKSALNLPGKVNTSNTTYFEDEQTYLANTTVTAVTGGDDTTAACESKGETAEAAGGGEMQVEGEEGASITNTNTTIALATPPPEIAYEMYQSFWELQVR